MCIPRLEIQEKSGTNWIKLRSVFTPFILILIVMFFFTVPISLAQSKMKKVNLNTGVKLKYVVEGPEDGIPIIFLHDATDSSYSWCLTIPFLSDTYRTYALDLRGHGNSEKPLHGYSIVQFSEDVIAFIDELAIERAVMDGHSLGSLIAHQLASVYADRVSHLVLLSSATTAVGNEIYKFLWDEIIGRPEFQDPIDPQFIRELKTGPNPIDPVFFENVVTEAAKVPAQVWKLTFRGLLTNDHTDFLDDINIPTLIMWGSLDVFFSLSDQQALQAALGITPDFVVFDNAGSNIHWEEPQEVASEIRFFIE